MTATADRIEWRRGFPARPLRALGSCAAAGGLTVAAAWMFFGGEPETLNTGADNLLARVPQWTMAGVVAVLVVAVVPVVRRPTVAADPAALTVRPGAFRTLRLPWERVAEITGTAAGGEEFLLVRMLPAAGRRPGFWDRAVLRAAARAHPRAVEYDLAVRMRDFAGAPAAKVSALAAYAPETVEITSRL